MDVRFPTARIRSLVWLPAFGLFGGAPGALLAQSCTVEFTHVATLGQLEDSMSVRVPLKTSVAEVPWGGWLVAEEEERVLRYDPDGVFEGPRVTVGQGPGELISPGPVVVDATDSTWISEYHGRALVYGPDGRLSRTLVEPTMTYVHGFTPGGLPYTVAMEYFGMAGQNPVLAPLIRVMDRMGREVGTYRPGPEGTRPNAIKWAPRIHPLSDSTFRFPASEERVIQTWASGSVTSSFALSEVARAAGVEDLQPDEILAMGVFPAGDGGSWLVVRVRRISWEREQDLVDSIPGYNFPPSAPRRFSPPIQNRAWDGVFMHLSADGEVTAVGITEDYPYSFSGSRQFMTATETEFGLVQLHIREFERACR